VGHEDIVRSVCISLDGKKIISGSDDKKIKVWNAETYKIQATLVGH
jgi:WD40 repeat protein